MLIRQFPTYNELSRHTAEHIAACLRRKPDATICLASGDTPTQTYRVLKQLTEENALDWQRCTFVGLDEWVGLGPDDEGSCTFYLYRDLFLPLGIRPDQIRFFNAKASDLVLECRLMDAFIAEHGGLDLLLVGIGMNGHIALNEPGTSFSLYSHVVELDEVTKAVGQKYFLEETVLTRGITLGLQHLMDAREVILLANGARKAAILRDALTGPVSEQLPASILQRHPNAHVWLDTDAAQLLP